jgi:hypothetical protein
MDKKMGTKLYEKIILPLLSGNMQLLPEYIQNEVRISQDVSTINLKYVIAKALFEELRKEAQIGCGPRILAFLKSGNLTERSFGANDSDRYIMLRGEKIDIVKLILESSWSAKDFQTYENEARCTRKVAEDRGNNSFLENNLLWKNLSEKLKWLSEWELLATFPLLIEMWCIAAWIATGNPYLVAGGYVAGVGNAFTDLKSGIGNDGKLIGTWTAWVFLGLSLLGGRQIAQWLKAPGMIKEIKRAFEILPDIMRAAVQKEGLAKDAITTFTKIITMLEQNADALSSKMGIQLSNIISTLKDILSNPPKKPIITMSLTPRNSIREWRIADMANAIETNKSIEAYAKANNISPDAARKIFIREKVSKEYWHTLDEGILDALITVHKIGKKWETVGKYGTWSLWEKQRGANAILANLTNAGEITKMLIKGGYLGTLSPTISSFPIPKNVAWIRLTWDQLKRNWNEVMEGAKKFSPDERLKALQDIGVHSQIKLELASSMKLSAEEFKAMGNSSIINIRELPDSGLIIASRTMNSSTDMIIRFKGWSTLSHGPGIGLKWKDSIWLRSDLERLEGIPENTVAFTSQNDLKIKWNYSMDYYDSSGSKIRTVNYSSNNERIW